MNRIAKSRIFITLAAVFTVLLLITLLPATKAEAAEYNGAVYQLSEDETYVIIIGYSEEFPKIEIPAEIEGLPVKEIAQNAFTNNYDLYSVVIPDTVTKIGEGAFRNCRSLVSVKLPAGLTELPKDCFMHCAVLKTVTLPETLQTIGDFCFEGCTKLGKIKIPASVTEIGYDAFVHCENILFDASENPYAAQYAIDFNVNTDYKGTSEYFWTVMAIAIGVALVIFFIISMIYLGYLKKHPEKNPNILIFKVLGKVYDALAVAIKAVTSAILWLITTLLWLITTAVKWLKFKFGKDKKKPKADNPDVDERTE